MEWFVLVLSVCTLVIAYNIAKLLRISKEKKFASLQREYNFAKQQELSETYKDSIGKRLKNFEDIKKTNVFREMAIDAIASQTLVYDPETGKYVRAKRIN